MHPGIKSLTLVAILLGPYRALAQPEITSPPAYCKASTLTGVEFMAMIQQIMAHGDLRDVSFVQKILGTKLRLTDGYGGSPIPNSDYLAYESDEVRGNPIHVVLLFKRPVTGQTGDDDAASLRLDNQSISEIKLKLNFIESCLQISGADFMSHLGGVDEFSPDGADGVAPLPPGAKIQMPPLSEPGDYQGPMILGYHQTQMSSRNRAPGIFLVFGFGHHPDGWPNKIIVDVYLRQFP